MSLDVPLVAGIGRGLSLDPVVASLSWVSLGWTVELRCNVNLPVVVYAPGYRVGRRLGRQVERWRSGGDQATHGS